MNRIRLTPIMLLILSTPLAAQPIYKCVAQNGTTIFSKEPCGPDAKPVDVPMPHSESATQWTFVKFVDDMTNNTVCAADSPSAYLGNDGSTIFHLAKLRVLDIGGTFGVTIEASELSTNAHQQSLHNDLSNTGVKVGDKFFPTSRKLNDKMAIVSEGDAGEMVELLEQGQSFRIRLRYWPYDTVFDNKVAVAQSGLGKVLDQVRDCR